MKDKEFNVKVSTDTAFAHSMLRSVTPRLFRRHVEVRVGFREDIMICLGCFEELEERLDGQFGDNSLYSSTVSDVPNENEIVLYVPERKFSLIDAENIVGSTIRNCELTHAGGWYDIVRWN